MAFLSQIIGKLFRFIYNYLVSLGNEPANISYYAIALLIMSVIYKLITIPLTIQSTKQSQKAQSLQPQMEELKKKYGYDQRIYTQKVQELQKEHNVAGAGCSSCLMMIIQMIIVIALFNVIREPQRYLFDDPKKINTIAKNFFWIKDLSLMDPTGFVLALLNSLTQFLVSFLSSMNTPGAPAGAMQTQKMMLYIFPLVFFFVFRTLPAGLVLYWVAGNIIEIIVKLITKAFSARKQEA